MSIIKLPKDGDEATFTVTACERVEGSFGPQVKFDGDNGETLYLPADSADRQLGRVFDFTPENGVDYTQAVGERLRFFRTPNTKKAGAAPYWNIEIATGPAKAPSERIQGPTDAPSAAPRPVVVPNHDPSAPPATEPPLAPNPALMPLPPPLPLPLPPPPPLPALKRARADSNSCTKRTSSCGHAGRRARSKTRR